MEGDSIDAIVGGFWVVLDKSLASDIPDTDGVILRSTCDASSIWMEAHRVNSHAVILKDVDAGL